VCCTCFLQAWSTCRHPCLYSTTSLPTAARECLRTHRHPVSLLPLSSCCFWLAQPLLQRGPPPAPAQGRVSSSAPTCPVVGESAGPFRGPVLNVTRPLPPTQPIGSAQPALLLPRVGPPRGAGHASFWFWQIDAVVLLPWQRRASPLRVPALQRHAAHGVDTGEGPATSTGSSRRGHNG
jgi:hypothetical protein